MRLVQCDLNQGTEHIAECRSVLRFEICILRRQHPWHQHTRQVPIRGTFMSRKVLPDS